jgi:sterol desaturase/sphingolipid hydroxylase (fatty acid hydroxylase superfamily)
MARLYNARVPDGGTRLYEGRHTRPLSRPKFVRRVAVHVAAAAALVVGSLAFGMFGYEYFEALAWRDAFLNAAMLLGGMGPVDAPQTPNGKLFAGVYALYAGLVFLIVAGLLFAPVIHRLLHKFHWVEDGGKN